MRTIGLPSREPVRPSRLAEPVVTAPVVSDPNAERPALAFAGLVEVSVVNPPRERRARPSFVTFTEDGRHHLIPTIGPEGRALVAWLQTQSGFDAALFLDVLDARTTQTVKVWRRKGGHLRLVKDVERTA